MHKRSVHANMYSYKTSLWSSSLNTKPLQLFGVFFIWQGRGGGGGGWGGILCPFELNEGQGNTNCIKL